jgi:hypothetical protein
MKTLYFFLLFLPIVACAQYDPDIYPSGTDSLNASYIRAKDGGLTINGTTVHVDDGGSPRIIVGRTDTLCLQAGEAGIHVTAGGNYGQPSSPLNLEGVGINLQANADGSAYATFSDAGRIKVFGLMPDATPRMTFWTTGADGTEIVNTASEVEFSDSIAIPAGAVETGMSIRFSTYYKWGHTNTPPAVTLRLKYNAEVIASVVLNAGAVSSSADPARVDWTVSVLAAGSTRTTYVATYHDGNTIKAATGLVDATLSGTDFSDLGRFALSAQWNAASVMNNITLRQVVGEYSDAR